MKQLDIRFIYVTYKSIILVWDFRNDLSLSLSPQRTFRIEGGGLEGYDTASDLRKINNLVNLVL